jgi:hypothetical protein
VSKTVKAAFEKWRKRYAPIAFRGIADELENAYLAGRRDLLAEQKRRAQLEAKRKRLTKAE